MPRLARGAAAILLVIGGGACGAPSSSERDERVGTARAAVQGGTQADRDSFAVGVCVGKKPGVCDSVCSGALIAPNLVMTSRHCVDTAPENVVNCSTAVFQGLKTTVDNLWVTSASSVEQTGVGWHGVTRVILTPGSHVCGNDLSVLVLDGLVPLAEARTVTPVLTSITDHAQYGTSLVAIGFGSTGTDGAGLGERRSRKGVPVQCIPGDPALDCGAADFANGLDPREFLSGGGVCAGDSGSSAFSQSELDHGRLISLGVLARATLTDGTCSRGVYTRTDAWSGLLAFAAWEAARIGQYAVPDWAKQAYSGVPASLGSPCFEADSCSTGLCASPDGEGNFVCSQSCSVAAQDCPDGFRCNPGATSGYCFAKTATAPRKSASCAMAAARAATPRSSGDALGATALLVLAAATRRRALRDRSGRR